MRKNYTSYMLSAMALHVVVNDNILTPFIPDLYEGLAEASRELVGMIPSVHRDFRAERAALGQQMTFPVFPAAEARDSAASMTVPTPPAVTMGHGNWAITKSRTVSFSLTGEEERGLNTSIGAANFLAGNFAEAVRTLTNEMEHDLYRAALLSSTGMTGVAGEMPFKNDNGVEDSALVRQLLDDAGAPSSDRSMVGNTTMGMRLRSLNNLTRVNEAGTIMGLRDGELLNLNGLSIKESGQADKSPVVTASTASGAMTDGTAVAVGATKITIDAAGTGNLKAGDYIRFAHDHRYYKIADGIDDISAGGELTLASPLMTPITEAVAIEVAKTSTGGKQFSASVAFHRRALGLVARKPAVPEIGDLAVDFTDIYDERSGLVFEVRVYKGYKMLAAEVGSAWGVGVFNPDHIKLLAGR